MATNPSDALMWGFVDYGIQMATEISRDTRATEKLDKKYRYLLTDIFDEKTLLFLESSHDNQTTRWRHLCNLVPDDISTMGSGKARIAYLTRHARVPLYLRTVGGEPPSPCPARATRGFKSREGNPNNQAVSH